nr:MAG TPA: hypothetical protein [Caudoviricetes sp.]
MYLLVCNLRTLCFTRSTLEYVRTRSKHTN